MNDRPTIGVALSGGSSRAIAHIAVLDVFKEHDIPVDYLVGCSSGALVTAAYAAHKTDWLKDWMMRHNLLKMIGMWSLKNAKGALFHVHDAADLIKLTEGLTFENAQPKIGFVASDLNSGELVTLSMGDVLTAIKAAIAVPGLLEPVIWGDKILVDGGLVSIVPTIPVKELGADIVIGVNVSGAKFIYEKKLPYWRKFRKLTNFLRLSEWNKFYLAAAKKVLSWLGPYRLDQTEQKQFEAPGIVQMLIKALDRSLAVSDKWQDADMFYDIMITPKVRQYRKTEFDNLDAIYAEGRRAALEAVPKIKRLIAQKTFIHELTKR